MKKMATTKQFTAVKYALIVGVAVFLSACNNTAEQAKQSNVSVTGIGTVSVKPDMVRMNISLSKTAQTTKLAQEEVSKMVRQAVDVLKGFNIEDKDISTASLTFNSEYNYVSGARRLIGQRADQRISFAIHNIQGDGEKVPQIIDRLVQINGIELNQVSFDVQNSAEYYTQARELAFKKAEEKAKQYAELSGLKVGKVLYISEDFDQQISPFNNRSMAKYEMALSTMDEASSILPAGEMEITTQIRVSFLLE